MKIVALLPTIVFLPLALVEGMVLREIDEKNGVVWLYERGAFGGITGVEGVSNNLLSLKIPAKLGGMPMSAISAGAFKSCEYITNVIVPSGIRLVGKDAFANCSNLVGVAMGGGRDCVKLIGAGAFRDCKKLEALELPDGLENVAYDAFHGCDALRRVALPTNCIYGVEGFSNCRGLEQMDIGGVRLPQRRHVREQDHVAFARKIDMAFQLYKHQVESINAPPNEARRQKSAYENNLNATVHQLLEENKALDRKDGPHDL